MKNNQLIQDQLEALVDETGLATVLEMLADICGEKAEHLRSAWQDERAAREWERKGRHVSGVIGKVA